MSELINACRQLHSIQQKLTHSLTQPPYTAGYVQQLILVALEILESLPEAPPVPVEAREKAIQGLQTAQVLADRFDTMNASPAPLYEMSDVLQPALDAVNRFLLASGYSEE